MAHEIQHSMRIKKCKTPYMALKIDLEKANDKLEWNFIRNALLRINMPQKMIKWIMTCISTVSFSLCFNGKISKNWTPERGIKQGDPISPYLFIICMNFSILNFIEGHNNGQLDGFQINKHSPPIPILCFADDCMIFCKANTNFVTSFKKLLKLLKMKLD